VQAQYPGVGGTGLYALFPVTIRPAFVFLYNVVQNGPVLSRESQEIIVPGDYGIFTSGMTYLHMCDLQGVLKAVVDGSIPETHYQFTCIASYSSMGQYFKNNCVALATKVCQCCMYYIYFLSCSAGLVDTHSHTTSFG
jgi:hypothetical protein